MPIIITSKSSVVWVLLWAKVFLNITHSRGDIYKNKRNIVNINSCSSKMNQASSQNTTGKNYNKINDKPYKILIVNVEDNRATQNEIKKYNISQNYIHIKLTANNNLMIHLKHLDDINKICNDGDIFSGNRKKNLEAEDNNNIELSNTQNQFMYYNT